jgi:hypothetical protein
MNRDVYAGEFCLTEDEVPALKARMRAVVEELPARVWFEHADHHPVKGWYVAALGERL